MSGDEMVMQERVRVRDLMESSGVKFGTSGARGLVTEMTDRVCYAYAAAFFSYLRSGGQLPAAGVVFLAGDRRPSTPRIMNAIACAASDAGLQVENCGLIPSPAVALRGISEGGAAVMVTGSHIPDDRNGIKFNTPTGEITKVDEAGMLETSVDLPPYFDAQGHFLAQQAERARAALGPETGVALAQYRSRYLEAFPRACLTGMALGVYGHSAVGRDLMVDLYSALGAEVFPLGLSEAFIPVDTEAVRPEDIELCARWARERKLDAILSTDGDSDRPLTADENGQWMRGDVTGILTAQFLGATAVATPVSCNTALEKTGAFSEVVRTRIGSPFVISGMGSLAMDPDAKVVGYEANGGFLTQNAFLIEGGGVLPALPTRDAVVVHLGLLLASRRAGLPLSLLAKTLPPRFTASARDPDFSTARSTALLSALRSGGKALISGLGFGPLQRLDETDGLRMSFESGEIVHLRASGNAPELRCYAEADTEQRALLLVQEGLEVARSQVLASLPA